MKTSIATMLFVAVAAFPGAAQQIGKTVASDLNGDGLVERFSLMDSGDFTADLQIENTGGGVIYAEDIAWIGGIGQQPELSLADNGSVRLTSMNEAIGRHRWHLTLTIAYRRGTYLVAGYTYDWYDTIELADNGICDLNLLTGRGIRRRDTGPDTPVRTDQPALPATSWKEDTAIPAACDLPN